MTTRAGLTSGNRSTWPANLSLHYLGYNTMLVYFHHNNEQHQSSEHDDDGDDDVSILTT